MSTKAQTNATQIAALNDKFRSRVGLPCFDADLPGVVLCTAGVMALPPAKIVETWFAVAQFNNFSEGDDPYGEHDFGTVDLEGAAKIFWKIDYYADDTMELGSDDPADPARCYRVLTIMLASEY